MTDSAKRSEEDTAFLRDLGARIATARRRRSQKEIAEACSLGVNTISRIELGKFAPSVFTLAALSKELGVSIDWLVFGRASAVTLEADGAVNHDDVFARLAYLEQYLAYFAKLMLPEGEAKRKELVNDSVLRIRDEMAKRDAEIMRLENEIRQLRQKQK